MIRLANAIALHLASFASLSSTSALLLAAPSLTLIKPCQALAFSPHPPPRFDHFSEELVGGWDYALDIVGGGIVGRGGVGGGGTANSAAASEDTTLEDDDGSPNAFDVQHFKVEEVMRSCGGAVQGIRDLDPLQTVAGGDEPQATTAPPAPAPAQLTYLNRANDGFAFTDDGSYTVGPVVLWTPGKDKSASTSAFQSNHSFGKCRVVVSCEVTVSDANETSNDASRDGNGVGVQTMVTSAIQCKKPACGDRELSAVEVMTGETAAAVPAAVDECTQLVPTVVVNKVIKCSMPSLSQPWMLQRVKWERMKQSSAIASLTCSDHDGDSGDANAMPDPTDNTPERPISKEPATKQRPFVAWTAVQSIQEISKRYVCSSNGDDGHVTSLLTCSSRSSNSDGSSNGGDQVFVSGAACTESGAVKSAIRQYACDGKLIAVLMIEGSLKAYL